MATRQDAVTPPPPDDAIRFLAHRVPSSITSHPSTDVEEGISPSLGQSIDDAAAASPAAPLPTFRPPETRTAEESNSVPLLVAAGSGVGAGLVHAAAADVSSSFTVAAPQDATNDAFGDNESHRHLPEGPQGVAVVISSYDEVAVDASGGDDSIAISGSASLSPSHTRNRSGSVNGDAPPSPPILSATTQGLPLLSPHTGSVRSGNASRHESDTIANGRRGSDPLDLDESDDVARGADNVIVANALGANHPMSFILDASSAEGGGPAVGDPVQLTGDVGGGSFATAAVDASSKLVLVEAVRAPSKAGDTNAEHPQSGPEQFLRSVASSVEESFFLLPSKRAEKHHQAAAAAGTATLMVPSVQASTPPRATPAARATSNDLHSLTGSTAYYESFFLASTTGGGDAVTPPTQSDDPSATTAMAAQPPRAASFDSNATFRLDSTFVLASSDIDGALPPPPTAPNLGSGKRSGLRIEVGRRGSSAPGDNPSSGAAAASGGATMSPRRKASVVSFLLPETGNEGTATDAQQYGTTGADAVPQNTTTSSPTRPPVPPKSPLPPRRSGQPSEPAVETVTPNGSDVAAKPPTTPAEGPAAAGGLAEQAKRRKRRQQRRGDGMGADRSAFDFGMIEGIPQTESFIFDDVKSALQRSRTTSHPPMPPPTPPQLTSVSPAPRDPNPPQPAFGELDTTPIDNGDDAEARGPAQMRARSYSLESAPSISSSHAASSVLGGEVVASFEHALLQLQQQQQYSRRESINSESDQQIGLSNAVRLLAGRSGGVATKGAGIPALATSTSPQSPTIHGASDDQHLSLVIPALQTPPPPRSVVASSGCPEAAVGDSPTRCDPEDPEPQAGTLRRRRSRSTVRVQSVARRRPVVTHHPNGERSVMFEVLEFPSWSTAPVVYPTSPSISATSVRVRRSPPAVAGDEGTPASFAASTSNNDGSVEPVSVTSSLSHEGGALAKAAGVTTGSPGASSASRASARRRSSTRGGVSMRGQQWGQYTILITPAEGSVDDAEEERDDVLDGDDVDAIDRHSRGRRRRPWINMALTMRGYPDDDDVASMRGEAEETVIAAMPPPPPQLTPFQKLEEDEVVCRALIATSAMGQRSPMVRALEYHELQRREAAAREQIAMTEAKQRVFVRGAVLRAALAHAVEPEARVRLTIAQRIEAEHVNEALQRIALVLQESSVLQARVAAFCRDQCGLEETVELLRRQQDVGMMRSSATSTSTRGTEHAKPAETSVVALHSESALVAHGRAALAPGEGPVPTTEEPSPVLAPPAPVLARELDFFDDDGDFAGNHGITSVPWYTVSAPTVECERASSLPTELPIRRSPTPIAAAAPIHQSAPTTFGLSTRGADSSNAFDSGTRVEVGLSDVLRDALKPRMAALRLAALAFEAASRRAIIAEWRRGFGKMHSLSCAIVDDLRWRLGLAAHVRHFAAAHFEDEAVMPTPCEVHEGEDYEAHAARIGLWRQFDLLDVEQYRAETCGGRNKMKDVEGSRAELAGQELLASALASAMTIETLRAEAAALALRLLPPRPPTAHPHLHATEFRPPTAGPSTTSAAARRISFLRPRPPAAVSAAVEIDTMVEAAIRKSAHRRSAWLSPAPPPADASAPPHFSLARIHSPKIPVAPYRPSTSQPARRRAAAGVGHGTDGRAGEWCLTDADLLRAAAEGPTWRQHTSDDADYSGRREQQYVPTAPPPAGFKMRLAAAPPPRPFSAARVRGRSGGPTPAPSASPSTSTSASTTACSSGSYATLVGAATRDIRRCGSAAADGDAGFGHVAAATQDRRRFQAMMLLRGGVGHSGHGGRIDAASPRRVDLDSLPTSNAKQERRHLAALSRMQRGASAV